MWLSRYHMSSQFPESVLNARQALSILYELLSSLIVFRNLITTFWIPPLLANILPKRFILASPARSDVARKALAPCPFKSRFKLHPKCGGQTQNTPLPYCSHRPGRDSRGRVWKKPHRPCLNKQISGKSPAEKVKYIYSPPPPWHTHPVILFRAGRGNPPDKRIKAVSIKMVFRLDLEK